MSIMCIFSSGKVREKPKVKAAEEEVCMPDRRGHSVAVISSSVMGNGDDELGKILMKGFIYALSPLDTLPETFCSITAACSSLR